MPTYIYGCGGCGTFEKQGGINDSFADCPACHNPARRRPYSGVPNLRGETVSKSIPDPAYRQEAQKRDLNRTWGDASRSVEMLRQNSFVDAQGNKQIDLKAMNEVGK